MGILSSCLSCSHVTSAVPAANPPAPQEPPKRSVRVILREEIELLERAKEDFRQGNDLFRADRVEDAILKYSNSLCKLKEYEDFPEREENHPDVVSSVGAQHFAEGRYIGAKTLINDVEKQRALMPDYHSIRDPCLRSLAQIMKFEITDRRVPHFQRIVVAEVQHHSDIDAITADIMNNMGACFEVQQNLDQAHQFYSESLKLRKVVFGERCLQVAEALQNLATVLDAQGHAREAEELLDQALGIEEEIRGKDSVENGVTMNNLGVLAAHLGNLPRAQVLLRRTLSLRRRDLGEGHELTQCSQRNLQHVERAIAEGREYATINNADEVKSPQEEENEDAVE